MRLIVTPIPTTVPVVIYDAETSTIVVDERLSADEREAVRCAFRDQVAGVRA